MKIFIGMSGKGESSVSYFHFRKSYPSSRYGEKVWAVQKKQIYTYKQVQTETIAQQAKTFFTMGNKRKQSKC